MDDNRQCLIRNAFLFHTEVNRHATSILVTCHSVVDVGDSVQNADLVGLQAIYGTRASPCTLSSRSNTECARFFGYVPSTVIAQFRLFIFLLMFLLELTLITGFRLVMCLPIFCRFWWFKYGALITGFRLVMCLPIFLPILVVQMRCFMYHMLTLFSVLSSHRRSFITSVLSSVTTAPGDFVRSAFYGVSHWDPWLTVIPGCHAQRLEVS